MAGGSSTRGFGASTSRGGVVGAGSAGRAGRAAGGGGVTGTGSGSMS